MNEARKEGRKEGWMHGWMHGLMGGWVDGWVDEWLDGWMMDGWMDGWVDGWMDGWMDMIWVDGWMDMIWVDGWIGWMGADGRVEGWMDGSSRAFPHKFLEIFEKVSRNFSKRCSKVAFCNESCSEVPRKNKYYLGSDAKICKLYSKIKISKHFCEILGRNQRLPAIFVSWERISREPAKTSREA